MEVKKSPKADLEGKKSTWLLIGYVVVLAFMFVAFEWTQRDVKIDTSQAVADVVFEEEIIPITEPLNKQHHHHPRLRRWPNCWKLSMIRQILKNQLPFLMRITHRK